MVRGRLSRTCGLGALYALRVVLAVLPWIAVIVAALFAWVYHGTERLLDPSLWVSLACLILCGVAHVVHLDVDSVIVSRIQRMKEWEL